MSFKSLSGVMRFLVEGRFSVVSFLTTLPPLNVVTVTFAAGVVLRVLRFLGAVAFGVADALDLTGIKSLGCVYPIIIPNKKPLSGFCNKLKQ